MGYRHAWATSPESSAVIVRSIDEGKFGNMSSGYSASDTGERVVEAPTRRLLTRSIWIDRFEQHLDQVPQLLETMREQRVPLAAARNDSERVSGGGGEAPLPLREDAVDDCDDLWGALVEYIGEVSERLQDPAPAAIGATWAIDGRVHGIPSWMSGDLAFKAGYALIAWLIDRGHEIIELRMRSSEDYLFALIRKLALRYTLPTIERPSRRRPCSICGESAVVASWVAGDTGEATCRVCGASYGPPASQPSPVEADAS